MNHVVHHRRWIVLALTAGAFIYPRLATAANPVPPNVPSPEEAATWKLEQIELKDGRILQGVIEGEYEEFVELQEVRRPAGKPMYLLVRPIERKTIKAIRRLSESDRAALLQKLATFVNRVPSEERRVRAIEISENVVGSKTHFTFAGSPRIEKTSEKSKAVWFTLDSTADDEATRRAIVRIEQAFVAFRQLFPARAEPAQPPRFLLFGTMEEYADHLRQQKLKIKNPAYYSPEQNLVVAGSDLTRYAEQLSHTRQQHERVRQEYAAASKQMTDTLRELTLDLEKRGLAPDERKKIVVAAQGSWDRELATLDKRIRAAERLNASLFDEVAGEMFARLYHEAFHAYLDNYLFPPDRPLKNGTGSERQQDAQGLLPDREVPVPIFQHSAADVPRWLNEGCAQLFESGLWEGDSLRIDAPHPRLLRRLQADLKDKSPLSLRELLTANPREFLVGHGDDSAEAGRYYAYSWGLAYYLLIDSPLLTPQLLPAYVAADPAHDPVQRFEAIVGQPLDKFEPEWRERMAALK